MEAINDDARRAGEGFALGEVIELFALDTTKYGGGVHYFAPAPVNGAAPSFDGREYQVVPFESEGWEWSSEGPMPRPTLTFRYSREDGDTDDAATQLIAMVAEYDDLVGCRITRLRTLRRFLDDGDEPNGSAHYGVEVYYVEQKSSHTASEIAFRLASALDHEGLMLPRRQAVAHCQLVYRVPDGVGGFDYANATCPYAGSALFDQNGDPTGDPAEDRCGLLVSHCRLRFGENARLPFGGFPGVGRIRTS